MIPVTVRIFVYTEAVDMRRGFDGLALIARESMAQDPRSGALFIFANKRADRLKALWWDRNGYVSVQRPAFFPRMHSVPRLSFDRRRHVADESDGVGQARGAVA